MHLINQPVDSEIQTVNELIREFVNTKIVDPNLRYKKCVDVSCFIDETLKRILFLDCSTSECQLGFGLSSGFNDFSNGR